MRAAILAAVACLSCQAVAAATVTVRSGEHDGFTRLVLQLPREVTWSLERTEAGYMLATGGSEIEFDASKAFEYITRHRIASLQPKGTGDLSIALACECHAVTSETPAGLLVIDVTDGPGPGRPSEPGPVQDGTAQGLDDFWLQRLKSVKRPAAAASEDLMDVSESETDRERMDAAARLLEWQISRAMGQGLVNPANETLAVKLLPPGPGRADGPEIPATAELGVAADTAHDKTDGEPRIPRDPAQECPASEDFAVKDWADERDFAEQIAEAKGALLGEFDAPEKEAVLKAVRFYLHFGLGVEGADLIRSFGLGPMEDHHLAALAEIIEGTIHPDNPLISLDCEGEALLWRALASSGTVTSGNTAEVIATYSALPVPLRHLLGTRLVDLFLARGDMEAARAVRDALLRGSGHGAAVTMIDISIALADPKAHPDPIVLVDQLAQQGENLPRAVILVIEAYQRRDIAVPRRISDLAESLAFEQREGAWGKDLRQAVATALASQGRFIEAFAQMDALAGSQVPNVPADLFGSLARKADDGQFLQLIFARMAEAHAPEQVEHWSLIGTRLAELGFPREAIGFLRRPAQTDADHLLAARIAAAEGRTDDALNALRGLKTENAVTLRQKLLSTGAQNVLSGSEGSKGPDERQQANPGTRSDTGLLGASRALLEQSNADRKSLEALVKGMNKP